MTMNLHRASEMTWPEVRDLDRERAVALLPLGAVEAHGPHLPLSTDRIIAQAMVEDGARQLTSCGLVPLMLPPVDYTAAGFAANFAGTVSIRPETATALLVDIAASVVRWKIRYLALANAHLDPTHLGSIYAAIEQIRASSDLVVIFPDITRKPWALRLSDEFKSGACHAGQYEGSVVMERRPDLVRDEIRGALPANPNSLSTAIRQGLDSFEAAGGPEAYFGDPASATVGEGQATIQTLGSILAEAVLAQVGDSG